MWAWRSARVGYGGGSRVMALKIGQQIDHAFTKQIGRRMHSSTPALANRVWKSMGELSRRGVHTVVAQVAVGMAHKGIKLRTSTAKAGAQMAEQSREKAGARVQLTASGNS